MLIHNYDIKLNILLTIYYITTIISLTLLGRYESIALEICGVSAALLLLVSIAIKLISLGDSDTAVESIFPEKYLSYLLAIWAGLTLTTSYFIYYL